MYISMEDPEPVTYILTDNCWRDASLVRFTLNRVLKTLGFAMCFASIPILIYSLKRHILASTFQINIKIILILYFVNALLQSLVLCICLAVMVSLSFNENYCSVYLSQEFYTFGQLMNFYLVVTQIQLQTVAAIERAVATLFCGSYERQGATIGIGLALLSLLSPVPIGYVIYNKESFDEPSTSVLIPPPSIASKINWLFVYGLIQCILSLIIIQFLRLYNRRRVHLTVGQIKTRFQTNENLATTSFITLVLSLQLSVYMVAGIGILGMRLTDHLYDKYSLTAQTIRTTLFLIPVFLLVLPILTDWEFRRIRRQRIETSKEHISKKATGEEGIENYKKAIYDTW